MSFLNIPTDRLQVLVPYNVRSIPSQLDDAKSAGDKLRQFIIGMGFDPDNLTPHQAWEVSQAYGGQEFTFYSPEKVRNVASRKSYQHKYFAEYDDQAQQIRNFVWNHGIDPDNMSEQQAADLAILYGKEEMLYYGPDMFLRLASLKEKSWNIDKKSSWFSGRSGKVLSHISGPSGSGKTTLVETLSKKYPNIAFKDLDEFDDLAVHLLGWGKVKKDDYTDLMLAKLAAKRQEEMDEFIIRSKKPVVLVGIHTEGDHVLDIPTNNKFLLDVDAKESAKRAYERSQHEDPKTKRSLSELPDDEKEAQEVIDFLKGSGYKLMTSEDIDEWIGNYSGESDRKWFYQQKTQKERDFSSTQFNLIDAKFPKKQGDPIYRIKQMTDSILDEDLTGDGREDNFHITVKYGLLTDDIEEVKGVVRGFGPVVVRLGETSIFSNEEEEVVKISVEGEDIHRLNALLKGTLQNEETHPEYNPHITLAYVKPGRGKQYINESDVSGWEMTFTDLTFSSKSGDKEKIDISKNLVTKIPCRLNSIKKHNLILNPLASPRTTDAGVFGLRRLPRSFHVNLNPNVIDEKPQKTAAIDIDGTICEYNGWKGEDHFGEIREGAREALQKMKEDGWKIIIFTTRGNTHKINEYLTRMNIPFDHINENPDQPLRSSGKVIADIYVDDRAISANRHWNEIIAEILEKQSLSSYRMSPYEMMPKSLIEVNDIRQEDTYSCGAICAFTVGSYFGVGPKTKEEWIKALHTNVEDSTRPTAIADFLSSLGLEAIEQHGMSIANLKECWMEGNPVIVPLQEYGIPSKMASFSYGHFVVVIGCDLGYVFVQDPSIDNVLEGEDSDAAPGRMMISEKDWMNIWWDKDADGNQYNRYGIIVGPGRTNLTKVTKNSYFQR